MIFRVFEFFLGCSMMVGIIIVGDEIFKGYI